jgi:phosphatidate cytidylyltransferase
MIPATRKLPRPLVPTSPFTDPHTFILAMGITVVLAVASAIGFGLKLTVAKRQPHGGIDNLNTRVNAWWAMAIIVGLALLAGRTGVTLLFAFASFAALREFVAPAPGRCDDRALFLTSACLVVPLQYYFVARGALVPYTLFIPAFALLAVPVLAGKLCAPPAARQRTATMRWGLVLCVWCISHVPALLALEIPGYAGRNAFLVVFFILVVQSSDVLQYLWGKFAGRRPIAPRLSPSKTVEGLVGGIGCATALGALLSPITPFSVAEAALLSLVITLLGFAGGLVLSAWKRKRGIKDWGTMIRGHGGMLDRLDSVCLSAPVFLHVVRLGWAS